MSKVPDHFGPIIILSSLVLCFGDHINSHDGQLKPKVIEDIVRKVCNISLNAFVNKDQGEKDILMAKIEERLKKSALSAGIQGEKYVNLIMRGVRAKASGTQENEVINNKDLQVADSDFVKKIKADSMQIMRKVSDKYIKLPAPKVNNIRKMNKKSKVSKSKDELVDDIAGKLEKLAKTYLKEAKTHGDRKRVIETIKKTFMASASKHKMDNKHEDIKKYVNLVAKGIAVMMQRRKDNKLRKMGLTLNDNLTVIKDISDNSQEKIEPSKMYALNNNEVVEGDNFQADKMKSIRFRMNIDDSVKSKSSCEETVQETCNKIKLVQKFRCHDDDKQIDILKLCDGVGDCLDFSDEQNCANQAMECIQSTNLLMQYMKTSLTSNCYPDKLDDSIITKQNKILGDVLQNQLTFLHSHTLDGSSKHSRRVFNSDAKTNKKIVNDAVTVVHTLSSVLEASLCKHLSTPKEYAGKIIASHKRINSSNLDKGLTAQLAEVIPAAPWVAERCMCDGKKCLKECSSECEQTCLRKFRLTQFKCSAVDGDESVSIEGLCDGKLDCFDESDETGCMRDIGLAKFEAIRIYNSIISMIETKSIEKGYESIRSRLQYLLTLVFKLQKISLKRHADVPDVKHRRDACFSELLGIYETALHYATSPKHLNDVYEFLQLLNEKLVIALKRSHTGNDKIISPDGCICRANSCVMLRCTKTCTRACSAEPMLSRYFCGGSSNISDSLPLELLCNGKKNCPNGDDETDCKPDVCRKHHLVVLRHNLRDVGHQQQGTALGEALRSWRVKVLATLMVAESNERPQPYILREMVNEILRDLVMTYASVDDKRRTDLIFKEFSHWSQMVIDVLKSCTI